MSAHITLVITNPGRLMQGCRTSHRFDWRGGTVGSQQCDWPLFDRAQGIQPLHCEVRWREGTFCVIDRCGRTFMNDANASLPPGLWVRLGAEDSLQIGEYLIALYLDDTHLTGEGRHLSQYSVSELLQYRQCPLDELGRPLPRASGATTTDRPCADPLAALDACARLARPRCPITDVLETHIRHKEAP
ncbi:hypothetical protein SFA35_19480 [Pseudomonas sp. HR96]|uniref:FHA domain-containing protein n=1 Tax=Pseudomonas sp. HR96 TaxID=1027966 RepID=UPI002A75E26A|nr:FHA domain-containing protein [Pseudomonas sp. HR96]WPO98788.1 hypothetical protein SFA35_19480 [Pseudomonas sp. HR96]